MTDRRGQDNPGPLQRGGWEPRGNREWVDGREPPQPVRKLDDTGDRGSRHDERGIQGYEDQPAPRRREQDREPRSERAGDRRRDCECPGTDGLTDAMAIRTAASTAAIHASSGRPRRRCRCEKEECGTDKPARRLREEHSDSQIGRQRISHLCREGAGREREQTRKELRCDPCDQERAGAMLSLPGGAVPRAVTLPNQPLCC